MPILPPLFDAVDTHLLTTRLDIYCLNNLMPSLFWHLVPGNVPVSQSIKTNYYRRKTRLSGLPSDHQCAYGGVSQTYEAGAWLAQCEGF